MIRAQSTSYAIDDVKPTLDSQYYIETPLLSFEQFLIIKFNDITYIHHQEIHSNMFKNYLNV